MRPPPPSPMPIEIGGPSPPTAPPPTAGRGAGPLATSSSLTKSLSFDRLPRLLDLVGFSSRLALSFLSFFDLVFLARFSRAGGGAGGRLQEQAGPTGASLATSDRLRARSSRRCAVAARSLLAYEARNA